MFPYWGSINNPSCPYGSDQHSMEGFSNGPNPNPSSLLASCLHLQADPLLSDDELFVAHFLDHPQSHTPAVPVATAPPPPPNPIPLFLEAPPSDAKPQRKKKKKKSDGEMTATAATRTTRGKKDRHSKICTAKGPRDRRMRLSLQIARKFFDLQDMLGFDKASKTIDWLFSKSKSAIKDLLLTTADTPPPYNKLSIPNPQRASPLCSEPVASRESREKARARARERTKEKMLTRRGSTNPKSPSRQPYSDCCYYNNPNNNEETGLCFPDLGSSKSTQVPTWMTPSLEHRMATVGIMDRFLVGIDEGSSSSAAAYDDQLMDAGNNNNPDNNNNNVGLMSHLMLFENHHHHHHHSPY